MMRVILNPMSRGGAGRAARSEIEQALASAHGGFEIVETTHAGHATDLARQAVADGMRIVVAAGGDGTIHEVANGILLATEPTQSGESTAHPPDATTARTGRTRAATQADVALGIIPIGTGNDFAKVVTGTRTRALALQTLMEGNRRAFDVGRVSWGDTHEYFVNAMGTGVDVEVVRQIQRLSRGTGALVYLQGLVRALQSYRAIPLRITADAETIAARVMLIAVANGKSIGGTFRIAPGARPDDGRLDLCIVDEVPLIGQLALVPRIVMGTHESSPRVRSRQVSEVVLEVTDGGALFFQLDGELREPAGISQLRVTIEAARLQIVAAAN